MEFSCLPGVVELEASEEINPAERRPARFKKELMRAGTYTHPQDPELRLTITLQRMEGWVEAFKIAPFKIYVPLRHTKDPVQNAGWVEDLFLQEERLYGILCITDEEIAQKIREGSIRDVSIAVEKDVTDAEGRTYEELITHVALTLDPHFREQEPFLELEGCGKNVGAQNFVPLPVEEEIKGYLAAGKITPASVPYLRSLLAVNNPMISLEAAEVGRGGVTPSLQWGDTLRAFLATLPPAVDYQELGQVEIQTPPGRLSPRQAEKEAQRILNSKSKHTLA